MAATTEPAALVQTFVEAEGWASPLSQAPNWQRVQTLFDPTHFHRFPWFQDIAQGTPAEGLEFLRLKRDAVDFLFFGKNQPNHRTSLQSTQLPVLCAFAAWCDAAATTNEATEQGAADYRVHPPERVSRFVHHRVEMAHAEWLRRRGTQPRRCAAHAPASLFSAFRHAIPALHRLAKWQGYALDLYKLESIQVLEERIRQDFRTAKVGAMDSAATSAFLTKRLQRQEIDDLFAGLWDGSLAADAYKSAMGRERAQMRAYISAALLAKAGKRGDDVRQTYLRMLFLHPFSDVGPVPCTAIGVSLRTAKDDDLINDNEHLMGFIRAADRAGCPITALANFIVWKNDRHHAMLPTMRASLLSQLDHVRRHGVAATRHALDASPPDWYRIPLLFAQNEMVAASTSTHRKDTIASLLGAGIENKRKVTHLFRYSTLGQLLEGGISTMDAALYQQWSIGVISNTYGRGCFNVLAMLKAHRWDANIRNFTCWWEGKDADVPAALAERVLVGLDEVTALAKELWEKHGLDRSAVEVCKVLHYLRRAFLEAAAHHRPMHPAFPAYRGHPVFEHEAWAGYATSEAARVAEREEVWRASQANPEVAALLERLETRLMDRLVHASPCAPPFPSGSVTTPTPALQPWNRVPDIPEAHPTDVAITYGLWADAQPPHASTASYFAETKRPAWTKSFAPEMRDVMKHRYHRQAPFWNYVDEAIAAGHERGGILRALQGIADDHRVDAAIFVRQCIYYAAHPPKTAITRPPPIATAEMIRSLEARRLPPIQQPDGRKM